MRFAFSATGGVSYHLIARRRARSLWAPFRAHVRSWLAPWIEEIMAGTFDVDVGVDVDDDAGNGRSLGAAPVPLVSRARELVVFGPSAGWTLPLDLFAGFSRVVFVEPDPVARFLLRRRLPAGVLFEFVTREDLLPWTSSRPRVFAEFLARYPGAAVLFASVLGQIPLIAKRIDLATHGEFLQTLSTRAWASYHDLYSGASEDAHLIASRDPSQVFKQGAVVDHETSWLSNASSQLALWPLTEKSLHVIEFVSAKPRVLHETDCAPHTSI
jgi:hypothetical protein